MKGNTLYVRRMLCLLAAVLMVSSMSAFTVVIDAGHGGKDPGALGARVQEKTLNLDVSKRLAKLIQANHSDVKVVMTRDIDKYLTLQERADIVNKNHADLFICIHTNAAENRKTCGAETFVLGINKLESNLDVAMRENAVMTLEDDYQTKYQGFDPNSVESYIMFEFMQDQYIDKSLQFASLVQNEFTGTLKRSDRGVRQAAFWVLHKSACPSVLVEMGFISNAAEEKYLASEVGREAIAKAIYTAFDNYKKALNKKLGVVTQAVPEKPVVDTPKEEPWTKPALTSKEKPWTKEESTPKAETKKPKKESTKAPSKQQTNVKKVVPEFRIQIFTARKPLKAGDPTFKGLRGCKYTKDGEWYKYTYGSETDYKKIEALKKQISAKFKDCFVVAFLGDEQIYVKDALKMIK